jgi:aryl-alcohol dehydrogenase-like predicted oxidoreductase
LNRLTAKCKVVQRLTSGSGYDLSLRLYNAISRTIESELIPAARKFGIRIITYNSLA